VRDLDRVAVIEAMLIENGHRSDLNVREDVDAIATLISIDTGVTPTKLSKRIGKSQRWVRDRMAITILPARWLDKLSDGDLTLAHAVAAAGCADLGPDHVERVCAELAHSGRWDHDPTRTVESYRRRIKLDAEEAAAIATCETGQVAYFTTSNPPPNTARSLVAIGADERAHRGEPCHAVYIRRDSWSDRSA
jgi:ParB-like chromosome segregation protein Spo0J